MTLGRTRVLTAAFLLAATAIGGAALWTGRGSHHLEPADLDWSPPAATAAVDVDVEPSYSQPSVRPIVESYVRDVASGARVLDLGCGPGAVLASFEGREWDRVGVDVSESAIERARRHYPAIRFILADATGDLPALLGHAQFDLVLSTETIEHVLLPRALVRNAYELLRPGGRLVISAPYHGYLKNLGISVMGRTDEHFDPLWDFGHVKVFSVRTLAALLWEAGFADVEYSGAGRVPYLWKSMVFKATKPSIGRCSEPRHQSVQLVTTLLQDCDNVRGHTGRQGHARVSIGDGPAFEELCHLSTS